MSLAQALHAIGRAMPRSLDRCLLLPVAAIALAATAAPSGAADTLAKGAEAYKAYVVEQIGSTLAGAKDLQAAIKAGDAKAAQAAWIKSRTGWERIEPITAEFFAELDEAIDSWPDAKQGYHAIEARLFAGNLSDLSAPTDKLVTAVTAFDKAVRAPNFRFSSQGLLNGVTKLAYELGEKKAKGGESPYAATSLIDMRDNLQGIDALYKTVLQEPLKAKDAKARSEHRWQDPGHRGDPQGAGHQEPRSGQAAEDERGASRAAAGIGVQAQPQEAFAVRLKPCATGHSSGLPCSRP
ncbi:MAG: EfeM/EfeO family lipoprotein [Rhodoplanes sp.]